MSDKEKLKFIHKQLEVCYDIYFGDANEDMELAFDYLNDLINEKNVSVID